MVLAWAKYPEEYSFLEKCGKKAEKLVKRLNNRMCMAIWCGNNEDDWGVNAH
jgi:beta-mannosidase